MVGLIVVSEEVVEKDEDDDEGAHAGAVEIQLVLHVVNIIRISTEYNPIKSYNNNK